MASSRTQASPAPCSTWRIPAPRPGEPPNDLVAQPLVVRVPTLDGETQIEFEPGTQPGEIRVLRGRGMPVLQGRGRGDQRILVNVLVPRRLSDEQRRILHEFEEHADEGTYGKADGGLFGKLKSAFR